MLFQTQNDADDICTTTYCYDPDRTGCYKFTTGAMEGTTCGNHKVRLIVEVLVNWCRLHHVKTIIMDLVSIARLTCSNSHRLLWFVHFTHWCVGPTNIHHILMVQNSGVMLSRSHHRWWCLKFMVSVSVLSLLYCLFETYNRITNFILSIQPSQYTRKHVTKCHMTIGRGLI